MTTPYDSTADTSAHIDEVQRGLERFIEELSARGERHDRSKLESPEKEAFDRTTPRLRGLTYGSPEYKAALDDLGPALKHHYQNNSHHPEYWTNGISGMSLFDIVEMFTDWHAASKRHNNGNFSRSLEINKERFGLSEQLAHIFENTRRELGW